MSTFKFSENLFIGKQELDRFLLFMRDQGFVRTLLANSLSFGIVRNKNDYSFDNAKVITGDLDGQVKVLPVLAIDKDGLTLFTRQNTTLTIPDDGEWHWIKISHEFTALEKGTVSIDANGNLTGSETEFTKVLRGQPNFPSRIRFPNASLNLNEYEVASVIDDQNAVLQGAFQVESDIKYEIVGTFTPGSFPTEPEKNPFQYDATKFEVIDEPSLTALTEGKEFYLARCKNNAGTVEIQDKRTKIFKTKASFELNYVPTTENPLIGPEGIHFGTAFSPLNANVMLFSWGFRSDNWTIDTTLNTLTLAGGQGGKYKSTSDFVDGDFNGWRAYTKDGKYSIVKSSTKSGSQINLVLDSLDPDRFSDATQEITVVPNAEAIQVFMTTGTANEVPDRVYEFPINEALKRMYVEVYASPNCDYNIKYRYRTFKEYSQKWTIPSDTDVGYFNEQSYDADGQLKDPVDRQQIPYTSDPVNGFITFTLNPNNLKSRVDELDTGVIFGVERRQLDNASPLIVLDPSSTPRYQIFDNASLFTLTVDHFINLNITNAIEGSEFILDFNMELSLNGFNLRVVQNYSSPGDFGDVLIAFDQFLVTAAGDGRLSIKFTYDGVDTWVPQLQVSDKPTVEYADLSTSLQSSIDSIPNVVDVTVGTTPPSNPTNGDIWIDTT